jgi:hypothetical protein
LIEGDVSGSWWELNFLSISLSSESSHLFDDVGRGSWLGEDFGCSVLGVDFEEDSATGPLLALLIDHGGEVFGLESEGTEFLGHVGGEVFVSNAKEGFDYNEL